MKPGCASQFKYFLTVQSQFVLPHRIGRQKNQFISVKTAQTTLFGQCWGKISSQFAVHQRLFLGLLDQPTEIRVFQRGQRGLLGFPRVDCALVF